MNRKHWPQHERECYGRIRHALAKKHISRKAAADCIRSIRRRVKRKK